MQPIRFRGYKLFYTQRDAAESMVRQIDEFPAFFTPQGERPRIIDCGANIGVSVLEWKFRWPQSQVICFEPDPATFGVLSKNVEVNDIPAVQCIQAAVSDTDGTTTLFGDLARGGDARGNSIDPAWGQREDSQQIEVRCRRLSTTIGDHEIAFLKLDIEGAEQRVLEEIAQQLPQVQALYVEVHETAASAAYNSVSEIECILQRAGFTVEAESRYTEHALPAHLNAWREETGASQTQLMAWR